MSARARVVVVGGGASGLLVAARLLDASSARPVAITVVEPTGRLGAGVAYGTDDPDHLVNVRASGMSADPSRPDDLVDWARATIGACDPDTFVARRDYRRYLADHLDRSVQRAADGSLEVRSGRAVAIRRDAEILTVHLHGGEVLPADVVVLALGNPPPGVPEPLAALDGHPAWVPDPWAPDALARHRQAEDVLLVGTGLTMVDVAVTMTRDHRSGSGGPPIRLSALSRTGLLPRTHLERQPARPLHVIDLGRDGRDVADLAHRLRERCEMGIGAEYPDEGWREVIDAVRPFANGLWRRFDADQRQRFLHDFAREWDVHRHRMAPPIGRRLHQLLDDGRLALLQGRLLAAAPGPNDRVHVQVELDGRPVDRRFDAVINCTGPGRPWTGPLAPLVTDLLGSGLASKDAFRLGLATDADGALVGADGRSAPDLFVIGPPRRGSLFETTAIPEIRSQALHIADRVVAAP